MANINPNCPCKNVGCPRHGNCAECKANHHASGGLTACERLAKEQEEKKAAQAAQPVKDDFSDIDISSLKDTDDYIFHNGKMVKQSTLLKMIREQQEKAGESQSDPSNPAE